MFGGPILPPPWHTDLDTELARCIGPKDAANNLFQAYFQSVSILNVGDHSCGSLAPLLKLHPGQDGERFSTR